MAVERYGAFGYPFAGQERERPLVAGWVLFLAAFLVPVLPALPVLGYLVRVIGASVTGEDAPSFLSDPAGLLRDSVVALVVCLGYLLVPLVLLVVTVYGAVSTSASSDLSFVNTLAVYGGSTVVLGVSFLGAYLLPVGLAVYATDRSLRAAFSPSHVLPVAKHAAYFTRWTAGAVAFSLSISFANLVTVAPRIGPVIAALVLSYGSIISAHVWGRAVRVARAR